MNRSKLTGYLYGSYGQGFVIEKPFTIQIYVPKGATERTAIWAHSYVPMGVRAEVKALRWWMKPLTWFRPVIWWSRL